MTSKNAGFSKRIENGRLRLMPVNEAIDTVEKVTPAFKRIADCMTKNGFQGILS